MVGISIYRSLDRDNNIAVQEQEQTDLQTLALILIESDWLLWLMQVCFSFLCCSTHEMRQLLLLWERCTKGGMLTPVKGPNTTQISSDLAVGNE